MQYPIIDLITSAYINNGWTGLDISTGKNILNPEYSQNTPFTTYGVTYSGENNSYHVEGTTTGNAYFNVSYKSSSLYMPVNMEDRGKYFRFITNFPYNVGTGFFLEGGSIANVVNGGQIPNNAIGYRMYVSVRNTDGYVNTDFYTMVSVSDEPIPSDTPYEPYGYVKNDFPKRLKLPLPRYFPHPVIDALISAADGQYTEEEKEILRHYLTPLGIGGI